MTSKLLSPFSSSNITSLVVKLLLLTALMAGVEALKCFQGQQSSTVPVNGTAVDCPFAALSCLKQEDPNSRLVVRSCQANNCTFNNIPQSTASCQNTTQFPVQQWCCCYGDGCNSAPGIPMTLGWQALLAVGVGVMGMSGISSRFSKGFFF